MEDVEEEEKRRRPGPASDDSTSTGPGTGAGTGAGGSETHPSGSGSGCGSSSSSSSPTGSPTKRRACVVVLGDVGRSPRMQYHASSLAKNGFSVDVVGYCGSAPFVELLDDTNISFHFMNEVPECVSYKYVPRVVRYFVKAWWQFLTLLLLLFSLPKPDIVLAQNPPGVPALGVLCLFTWFSPAILVVDWHNYSYSIMSLTQGKDSYLVTAAHWFEFYFGRRADKHFCVTAALQEDLKQKEIQAVTLYDRPSDKLRSITLEEKHELMRVLAEKHEMMKLPSEECVISTSGHEYKTLLTQLNNDGELALRSDRPAILMSSTSWTEDEDFSILLSALDTYDCEVKSGERKLPDVICIITGKGPLKEYYSTLLKEKSWSHVKVSLMWLSTDNYRKLLATADLGISMHTSSSGLDLPMKVVDMFGVGLPVLAMDFNCIGELVRHEENGMVFRNDQELAQQMADLLENFPRPSIKLQSFRENMKVFQALRWDESWKTTALPELQAPQV